MSADRQPAEPPCVAVTIAYVTHRPEPQFEWFIDGLAGQLGEDAVEVLFIDGRLDARRCEQVAALVGGRFAFRHLPPKPNPWNGPHRLTRDDLWAAASARNTAIVHARGAYLAYVDDCSVLGPHWWEQVRLAAREGWVVAGAYQKHRRMRVRDGVLVDSEAEEEGRDTRWALAGGDEMVTIAGGQLYGNCGAPRDLLVAVNGFDELCDPMGGEDYHLGIRLEHAGHTIRYSRRMLTIESRDTHVGDAPPRWGPEPVSAEAYAARLAAFGVQRRTTSGPCDPSHMVLDILYGTRAVRSIGNYYDVRDLDDAALAQLPARFPQRHWFSDTPLAELPAAGAGSSSVSRPATDADAAPGLVYHPVRVAGRPAVDFCLDPNGGDPVARWLLDHGWIDEPVMRLFLSFVTPGSRVVDLGSHLGTFSLPAAAGGGEVISVDGSPRHVQLLGLAARQGSLALRAVHGAIGHGESPAAMLGTSIHTRLARDAEAPGAPVQAVPRVTVDELTSAAGWDRLDVVKIDVEGNEPAALAGMARTFAEGQRPVIVLECNQSMLPLFGSSPAELRRALEQLGYRLFQIDHLHPGTLVATDAEAVQTEAAVDLLALPPGAAIAPDWELVPHFSLEQILTRLLDQAASPGDGYRLCAAQTIAAGPAWLTAHPLVAPAAGALRHDLFPAARAAIDGAGARDAPSARADARGAASPPSSAGPPADIALWIDGLALERPSLEPDQPLGRAPADEDILVRDGALYLRRSQLLGVLGDDGLACSELLRAFAGLTRPLGGHVHAPGRTVLVADIAAVLEPDLSVSENATVYGTYLGVDARVASRDVDALLHAAALSDRAAQPLGQCSVDAVLRLVFAVALQWAQPNLLLVDRLPACADPGFRAWLSQRTAELRQHRGAAVVQVVPDSSLLLGPPDRMLWVSHGRFTACGHPASVTDAAERAALNLWSTPRTPSPVGAQP